MCGICGFLSKDLFSYQDGEEMTSSLTHRGPDSKGGFSEDTVYLGHTRLSILDLSSKANQPIHSHDGRFVMVYNGEVYNYEELAHEIKLLTPNICYRTNSDSEIVLEAFVRFGSGFIDKLNGMFAMAIYDRIKKELYLFRDRVGIKPLYYFWDGKNLAFSSELKSLTKLKQIPKKTDKKAIAEYLHLGFIPSPLSIYESIKKLDSGCYLKIAGTSFEIFNYWNVFNKIQPEIIQNENFALEKLNELIGRSVKYQLKSDVPFGIFLSGGTDSSLVAAYASKLSDKKVNTFSIGFRESHFDESPFARNISSYLGTDHHELIVSYQDAIPLAEIIISVYDEPFSDSSAIPTLIVSKMARKYVKVALSGEGGDELFFGYGSHIWAKRLSNPISRLLHRPISSFLKEIPSNRFKRASTLFRYSDYDTIQSHIFSQEQYCFSKVEINSLLNGNYNSVLNTDYGKQRMLTPIEKQALFDFKIYLKDDLLTKVDRASMYYSLETRVPFLDHNIVEFAINLSPGLKLRNGTSKYILKKLLYTQIPEKYFQRKKQGFAIPLKFWLQKELKYLIDNYLGKEVIEQCGIVNYNPVESLKKQFFRGNNYLYNRLWQLIILHKFLKERQ